jgi:N-acetylglucosaminyldiphosphoundecaprenol N-acetyl-beta-D-mannosaminyltransferase
VIAETRKRGVLGVLVDAVELDPAAEEIVRAARDSKPMGVAALAVHGVMNGLLDPEFRFRLNQLDLVVPDGQPVRWAMNLIYRTGLRSPVRGTDLTVAVLERAALHSVPVYVYGSTPALLKRLVPRLKAKIPALEVAGFEPSLFREAAQEEIDVIAGRITASRAGILLVGLGCPRQEVFIYELRERLAMPLLAVGAAFDYLAGRLTEPPMPMRDLGLEWLWRLAHEPRRLWRRYLVLNPAYAALVTLQALGWKPDTAGQPPRRASAVDA